MTPSSTAKSADFFTWDDYQSWDDGERWEIIDGEAYNMSPAPRVRHQEVLVELITQLRSFFRKKACTILLAPTDVKLSEHDVVQPDILVVCDANQLKETHVEGPPALVVEILSPTTEKHDRIRKLRLYAKYGVQEYWIVTPYPSLVEVLVLKDDQYQIHGVYSNNDQLTTPSFAGLKITLNKVFDFPISENERIDEVRESTPPYAARREASGVVGR